MAVMERLDTELVRRLRWDQTDEGRLGLAWKEWLVTNGLGGYASGTIAGTLTRRFHALLIAALPTPFGRTVMFVGSPGGHRRGTGIRRDDVSDGVQAGGGTSGVGIRV